MTFHHTALKLLPLASCSWIAAVDISTLPFEEQKRLKDDWNELKLRLIEVYTRCDVHHASCIEVYTRCDVHHASKCTLGVMCIMLASTLIEVYTRCDVHHACVYTDRSVH